MCSSSSGNAEVSSDGGGRVQGRFDRTFDRAMPVLRRLTGWHAIAMLSPAVEPKGAGWVLVRLLWGCHLASLPCPLAEPPLCRQLRWVAGRGPRPSPPYATDPAFTPAAREEERILPPWLLWAMAARAAGEA